MRNHMKVMNVKMWQELALSRNAWKDPDEKNKTHDSL